MTVEAIEITRWKERFTTLDAEQGAERTLLQDLADYIVPRKNGIFGGIASLEMPDHVFDPTGIHANELLAATMAGTLTNRSTRWFTLKPRASFLADDKETTDRCDEWTDQMSAAMAESNFYGEVNENYLDLGGFGQDGLFIEAEDGWPRYAAQPVGEFVFAEDSTRRVRTFLRKFKWSAAQIVDRWGKRASAEVRKAAESSEKDKKYEVLHVLWQRHKRPVNPRAMAKDMPIGCLYIEWESNALLEEGGYHEWPLPVTRWSKASGCVTGRGPGHTALPILKTLSATVEQKLLAGILSIRPPLLAQQFGVIGKVRIKPAAINMVTTPASGPGAALAPLFTGADIRPADVLEEQFRKQVHLIFFSDLLNLPTDGPQRTAREVMIMHERMQQALGPTLGRLEYEKFNPTIERTFGIMMRGGRLAPPSKKLMQAWAEGKGALDIVYQGPLARAQRSGDVLAIERFIESRGRLAELTGDPSVWDIMDLDEMGYHEAEVGGVPSKGMRSVDKVAELRGARAEGAAKQAEMENALAATEGMRNVAPLAKMMKEA